MRVFMRVSALCMSGNIGWTDVPEHRLYEPHNAEIHLRPQTLSRRRSIPV